MADTADIRIYPPGKVLVQTESFQYADDRQQNRCRNDDIYKDALLFSGFDAGLDCKICCYVDEKHEKPFKGKGFVVREGK